MLPFHLQEHLLRRRMLLQLRYGGQYLLCVFWHTANPPNARMSLIILLLLYLYFFLCQQPQRACAPKAASKYFNGQSHPFAPWSKCKKRSRRYSLRLRFDPFSKLRHHSTPYCCLNKSATLFCFLDIGRPDEARLAAYSAQSSATRASICASLVWFNAPRSDTTVS